MKNIEILTQTILPFSLHGINPRTIMGEANWNKVKKQKQIEADHHCMICNEYVSHTPGDWLECHEVYDINFLKKEFILKDFVSICKRCHDYIHQGRLRVLVAEEKITIDDYNRIIERGDKILAKNGLKKQDLSPGEINNPNWYLLYEGKKYSNSQ